MIRFRYILLSYKVGISEYRKREQRKFQRCLEVRECNCGCGVRKAFMEIRHLSEELSDVGSVASRGWVDEGRRPCWRERCG